MMKNCVNLNRRLNVVRQMKEMVFLPSSECEKYYSDVREREWVSTFQLKNGYISDWWV